MQSPLANNIKLLSPYDSVAIALLHKQCFKQSWQDHEIADLMNNPINKGLGLYEGDQLIGFLMVACIPPEADILTLCVAPPYQRHGYGTLLLRALINYCHNYSIDIILLDVSINNKTACDFYRKHKFSLLNIRKDYYKLSDNQFEDAKTLKLNL